MGEGRVERRLAAILAVDVAGYSRLMGARTKRARSPALRAVRRQLSSKYRRAGGRFVKTTGDGLVTKFASVVDAVSCAVEVQREMIARNSAFTYKGKAVDVKQVAQESLTANDLFV
jgi:adenylate cyclase